MHVYKFLEPAIWQDERSNIMATDKRLQYEELRLNDFTEAFNAISSGNGYFIPVSQLFGGKLQRKILARYPTWELGLETITTSGGGIFSIRTWDDVLEMNIFGRPHIEYADLIFKSKGDSVIFCDLKMEEAQECLFVKYERRGYSHYITLCFGEEEREFQCTNYGSEWACFPV